jgi:hypothetical protein
VNAICKHHQNYIFLATIGIQQQQQQEKWKGEKHKVVVSF